MSEETKKEYEEISVPKNAFLYPGEDLGTLEHGVVFNSVTYDYDFQKSEKEFKIVKAKTKNTRTIRSKKKN